MIKHNNYILNYLAAWQNGALHCNLYQLDIASDFTVYRDKLNNKIIAVNSHNKISQQEFLPLLKLGELFVYYDIFEGKDIIDCSFDNKYQGIILNLVKDNNYKTYWHQYDLALLFNRIKELRQVYPKICLAGDFVYADLVRILLLQPDLIAITNPRTAQDIVKIFPLDNKIGQKCKIILEDHIVPMFTGVYDYEKGILQKISFNVELDVAINDKIENLADIFSYDIIIDAINIISRSQHIDLLEQIAQSLCEILLLNPQILYIKVRLYKLGLIKSGRIGIEIERCR